MDNFLYRDLYQIQLLVEQVSINLKFPCQIMVLWKIQNQEKFTSSKECKKSTIFNQILKLHTQINSTQNNEYLQKKKVAIHYQSTITIMLRTQSGNKIAGIVQIYLEQIIVSNSNKEISKIYFLQKCLDKNAFIQVTFKCTLLQSNPIHTYIKKNTEYSINNERLKRISPKDRQKFSLDANNDLKKGKYLQYTYSDEIICQKTLINKRRKLFESKMSEINRQQNQKLLRKILSLQKQIQQKDKISEDLKRNLMKNQLQLKSYQSKFDENNYKANDIMNQMKQKIKEYVKIKEKNQQLQSDLNLNQKKYNIKYGLLRKQINSLQSNIQFYKQQFEDYKKAIDQIQSKDNNQLQIFYLSLIQYKKQTVRQLQLIKQHMKTHTSKKQQQSLIKLQDFLKKDIFDENIIVQDMNKLKDVKQLTKKYQKEIQTLINQIELKQITIEKQQYQLHQVNAQNQNSLQTISFKIRQYQNEIQDLKRQIQKLAQTNQKQTQYIDNYKNLVKTLCTIIQLEEQCNQIRGKVQVYEEDIKIKDFYIKENQKEIQNLNEQVQKYKAMTHDFLIQIDKGQRNISINNQQYLNLRQQYNNLKNSFIQIQSNNQIKKNQLQSLKQNYQKLKDGNSELEQMIKQRDQKIKILKQQIIRLDFNKMKLQKELKDVHQQYQKQLNNKNNLLRCREGDIKIYQKQIEEMANKLNYQINFYQSQLDTYKLNFQNQKKKNQLLRIKLDDMKSKLVYQDQNQFQERCLLLQYQLQKSLQSIKQYENQLNDQKNIIKMLQNQKNQIKDNLNQKNIQVLKQKSSIEQYQQKQQKQLIKIYQKFSLVNTKFENVKQVIRQYLNQNKEFLQKTNQLKQQNLKLNGKLQQKQLQIKNLQECLKQFEQKFKYQFQQNLLNQQQIIKLKNDNQLCRKEFENLLKLQNQLKSQYNNIQLIDQVNRLYQQLFDKQNYIVKFQGLKIKLQKQIEDLKKMLQNEIEQNQIVENILLQSIQENKKNINTIENYKIQNKNKQIDLQQKILQIQFLENEKNDLKQKKKNFQISFLNSQAKNRQLNIKLQEEIQTRSVLRKRIDNYINQNNQLRKLLETQKQSKGILLKQKDCQKTKQIEQLKLEHNNQQESIRLKNKQLVDQIQMKESELFDMNKQLLILKKQNMSCNKSQKSLKNKIKLQQHNFIQNIK